jgi:WD40 repeat protein
MCEMDRSSKRAAFSRIVVVLVFSALVVALLIQIRRAADLERRLRAAMARAARIEDQLQAEQGLLLEAPPAAHSPSVGVDSSCRLTSAWLRAGVSAASFAPDGARVAAIVGDEIRIWDAAMGRLARQIRFENESPVSLTFSPDRCTLAVGVAVPHSRRSGIRIIRYTDEGHQAEFWGELFDGRYLAFSHDGRTLAYSRSRGVTFWNTITARPDFTIEHRRSDFTSLALSPRGDRLAFGDGSGHLTLWDLTTKKEIGIIKGHRRAIVSIDFSPDGDSAASGSLDHVVKIWDAATGRERASLHQESDHGCIDRVLAVRFSPRGETLVSAHLDWKVRYWETASYRLAGTSILSPCPDRSEFGLLSMTLSPDGRSLVGIGSRDAGVELCDKSRKIAVWDVLDLRSTHR